VTAALLSPREADAALALAVVAARAAGAVQVDRLGRAGAIRHKSARDVVTDVDHASERLILDAIRHAFPSDAILAEESGEHTAGSGHAPTAGTGRAWIVDPLDGTFNYTNGIPFFGVSIALAVEGRPAVGVILDPVRDELFTVIAGHGARLGGRRLRAARKELLQDCVVDLGYPVRDWPSDFSGLRRSVRATRHLGSSALGLAYVAASRLDAYLQPGGMSNWDVAAAALLAEEAGATVTTVRGEPWFDLSRAPASIGLLAASPRHHARLAELFREGAGG
jgi:myo-inositol-1(or 4)-monophosphatase